jgi:CBS domain-containing protein
MRNTIMTEKIARRGVRVPAEYEADLFDQVLVRDVASKTLVTLRGEQSLQELRRWIASHAPGSSHQGFPVLDERGVLLGVLTRRVLLDPAIADERRLAELIRRHPTVVYDDNTLRDAADHMVRHEIGRLPVIERATGRLVAMVTRSDLLGAHRRRLRETHEASQHITWPKIRKAG